MKEAIVAVMLVAALSMPGCIPQRTSASDTITVADTPEKADAMRRAAEDKAAVAHREAVNAEEARQVARTNLAIFWTFVVGLATMSIGLFGIALSLFMPAVRAFIGACLALAVGGGFVWAVAIGLSDYRQAVGLVAVCAVGGCLAGGAGWAVVAWVKQRKATKEIVGSVERAKELVSETTRKEMFGDQGALASVMDPATRKVVAKTRRIINASSR